MFLESDFSLFLMVCAKFLDKFARKICCGSITYAWEVSVYAARYEEKDVMHIGSSFVQSIAGSQNSFDVKKIWKESLRWQITVLRRIPCMCVAYTTCTYLDGFPAVGVLSCGLRIQESLVAILSKFELIVYE